MSVTLTLTLPENFYSRFERADFLMLRKSQAYLQLKNRGRKLPSIEQLRQS